MVLTALNRRRVWYDQDASVLRNYARERNELVGPIANYYSLIRGANVDPLYSEPVADPLYGGPPTGIDAKHDDAFEYEEPRDVIMNVTFERATGMDPQADDAGLDAIFDGEAYIARDEWERVWTDRDPKSGDVLWVSNEWWDVKTAKTGGHVMDSGTYVEWKLELRKRDRFTPDRKV